MLTFITITIDTIIIIILEAIILIEITIVRIIVLIIIVIIVVILNDRAIEKRIWIVAPENEIMEINGLKEETETMIN